jgi:hypothetical protein
MGGRRTSCSAHHASTRGELMASTVTIILTGVVYLAAVPQPTPTKLRALMVKSDNDRVSTQGGAIPRHVAFVKIPSDKVASGASDLIFDAGVANSLFVLNGEKIEVSNTSTPSLAFPALPEPVLPIDPNAKTAFDKAIIKADVFCPTCPTVDFDRPNLKHVGGMLDLTAGTVVAKALSPCTMWNFAAETGYPAHTQKFFGRQVAVELKAEDGKQITFTLTRTNRDGNPEQRTIVLKPDITADVMIGSATMEDIIGVGGGHSADRVDHHFELFYYLLERSNRFGHPLPVADPTCGATFHRLNGVDCPPVQQ